MPLDGQTDDSASSLAVLQTLDELKSYYRNFTWESQLWERVGPNRSPYRVMVLFGLSARTKDKLLVETCRGFFHHFPNSSSLMKKWAPQDPQFRLLVRNGQLPFIDSLCVKLKEWGGDIPADKARLIQVVGVGEKIAECVLAYGWGIESLPMDGNGCRMYQRLMGLPDVAKHWRVVDIRDRLKAIFNGHRLRMERLDISMVDIHESLRLHSQLVCGRSPNCQHCPITRCLSRRLDYLGCGPSGASGNLWREWRDLILEQQESEHQNEQLFPANLQSGDCRNISGNPGK